jgi:uncharacterized NAD(P)/FAD-binding protein YdhS/quercetin dioxygenase-like cupin family protein
MVLAECPAGADAVEVQAELVRRLQGCTLDGPALEEVLGSVGDLDVLLSHAAWDEERYVRVPLHIEPAFEVRLICWQPGQGSALHAHGVANGAMRVLQGQGVERRLGLKDRSFVPGCVLQIEPDVVHQVENTGSGPLATLHVYAPPLPVDQPSGAAGERVVIVGGGWSGVATAIQLLRVSGPSLRMTIVERSGTLGRGVAYGAAGTEPTLNVPAGRMGLDPEAPGDFVEYARSRGVSASARSLLPRKLYGDYVLDRLAATVRSARGRLRIADARVVRVTRGDLDGDAGPDAAKWAVTLSDGRVIAAENVVLASGHGPAHMPEALGAAGVPTIAGTDVLARPSRVAQNARVLVVGTGLTALDVVGVLRAAGHSRTIEVVGTTAAWPHRHLATLAWTGAPFSVDAAELPLTSRGLSDWFDAAVARAAADNVPWQAVVDAVRPHISAVWRRMPDEERARFLVELRPNWERMRHRAPGAQLDTVKALEDQGMLRRTQGSVLAADAHDGAWRLTIGDAVQQREVVVDTIVLCTGPSSDVRDFSAPWPELIKEGHVVQDRHRLGIDAGPAGEVIGNDGRPHGLWAIGGLLRARDFESTAVPELARQARELSLAIAADIAARPQPPLGGDAWCRQS